MASSTILIGCRTTKIYCRPDCPAGRHMKPENGVAFRSREEARQAGYRPCKVCRPDEPAVEPERFFWSRYVSPLGAYILVSSQKGIVCMKPDDQERGRHAHWERGNIELRKNGDHNSKLANQLDAYFGGKLFQFDVSLDLRGTPFQLKVWEVLCGIPYGKTRSYREVAEAAGRPNAARPVGGAVGTNPVSIVVPCHRVIGSNGKLTGYGGGLDRKKALLDLEQRRSY